MKKLAQIVINLFSMAAFRQKTQVEQSTKRVVDAKMDKLKEAKQESRKESQLLGRWLDEMRSGNGA